MNNYFKNEKWDKPITFAVKHKDIDVRMASRSGGVFTALTDYVLLSGGIVYGCVLDDSFSAIHIRATEAFTRDRMRGSKYIQSEMGDVYKKVKEDLDSEKYVLFSGTSCQVSGLIGFLGKSYENLLTIDIVCHGVPSPLVWKDYIYWQEEKNHSKVKSVEFRNKKDFGWKDHVESIVFENGKIINSRVFTTLFYEHSILRPSCYVCPYKDIIHPGNITLADYWGIDNATPGFNDDKGVSLVLINDETGYSAFKKVSEMLDIRKTRIEDSMQPPLETPCQKPENRSEFWKNDINKTFLLVEKNNKPTKGFYGKVKRKINKMLKHILND